MRTVNISELRNAILGITDHPSMSGAKQGCECGCDYLTDEGWADADAAEQDGLAFFNALDIEIDYIA